MEVPKKMEWWERLIYDADRFHRNDPSLLELRIEGKGLKGWKPPEPPPPRAAGVKWGGGEGPSPVKPAFGGVCFFGK